MIKFAIIGKGWRAEFFKRITNARPDLFTISAIVVQNKNYTNSIREFWNCPIFTDIDEMIKSEKPQFTIVTVPREAAPPIVKQLVDNKMPVLCETPPASNYQEMIDLFNYVSNNAGKVQISEQYFLQPHNAARLNIINKGFIGSPNQAQISAAHEYHGISLIRKFLNVNYENPRITAKIFKSPIVEGRDRFNYPSKKKIKVSEQSICHFDYGDKLGIMDFTDDQYFSRIRNSRFLIRGEKGEIQDNTVYYLKDFKTPIKSKLRRLSTGIEENLEGNFFQSIFMEGEEIYSNILSPASLSDDEIAMGVVLLRMAEYVETGKDVYSLSQACQDYYLSLLCKESIEKNKEVQAETQIWADIF